MTEPTLSQKEQAYAFARQYGFTIGLETVARRTRYWATRGDSGVEALGYSSLLVRMRKHAEGLKLLPVKTFSKTQSRGAQKAAEVRDMPKITPVALNWKAPVPWPSFEKHVEFVTPEEALERVAQFRRDHPDVIKTWTTSEQETKTWEEPKHDDRALLELKPGEWPSDTWQRVLTYRGSAKGLHVSTSPGWENLPHELSVPKRDDQAPLEPKPGEWVSFTRKFTLSTTGKHSPEWKQKHPWNIRVTLPDGSYKYMYFGFGSRAEAVTALRRGFVHPVFMQYKPEIVRRLDV